MKRLPELQKCLRACEVTTSCDRPTDRPTDRPYRLRQLARGPPTSKMFLGTTY